MTLSAGDRLGRYEILGPLGAGGMGEVYRARDTSLEREVAVKVLPEAMAGNLDWLARFEREAKAVARLSHPNILDIHDYGQEGDFSYAVTELLEGESLFARLARGPLGWRRAAEVGAEIADGLASAHQAGLVHRDLKPSNVFLTADGRVKILDFGLSKLIEGGRDGVNESQTPTEALITATGAVVGTVGYMSPEQLRGRSADTRSDIFSLGCVLYEMVAGRRAFVRESSAETMMAILSEEPEPMAAFGREVPLEYERTLLRCLEKEPQQRIQSAADLSFGLRDVAGESGPRLATVPRPRRLEARWPSRSLIGVGAAVAVLIAAALWLAVRPSLAFSRQDRVLVADVDNRSGEPAFDIALRTAIEADIQQSSYAIVYDRGQIGETLQLMRRDPDTRIDELVGSEICRFSGVRALVVPRVVSVGDAFELQAILVDPVRRRQVDRIRVTALGREQVLLNAVDELAREVRSRLGESMGSIEQSDLPVIRVTTSSWEALEQVTRGYMCWHKGEYQEAASLFELALEEDPGFATARASLGMVLIQFLGEAERGKAELRQALADADELPRREQLLIRAASLQMADGDLLAALEQYGVISELYPDCSEALNNSGIILRTLGRFDEAVEYFERAAEQTAYNTVPLANLYFTHMYFRQDPRAAEWASRRLIELGPEVAHFRNALAWTLISQARLEEAVDELRVTLAIEPHHQHALPNLAHVLLALGSTTDSVPIYEEVLELVEEGEIGSGIDKCTFDLAFALAQSGEAAAASEVSALGRQQLLARLDGERPGTHDLLILGQLFAVEGNLDRAREHLSEALAAGVEQAEEMVLLAELHALLGESDTAIEVLLQALDSGYRDRFFPLILPAFQSVRDHPDFRALFEIDGDSV
jgi:serine/threonine protein kinase/tetratricopeptide (TPR) repeat protein